MYISYSTSNGYVYAQLAEAEREDDTVRKTYVANLGRVLDKGKGIYRNRERGVFTYDLTTDTYGTVPADFKEPPKRKRGKYIRVDGKKRSRLCIEFGDSYFLDKFLNYLLSQKPNSHMEYWYELNYVKYLFPNAVVSSQRISEALAEIGMEESKREFFSAYYAYVKLRPVTNKKGEFIVDGIDCGEDGILIDSTGLPNSAHLPLTAVSNHNGTISLETRLIYVVQQGTGLPLFFTYVAGNVIDASTIRNVISHLKRNGINTKFAILDAGYYNGINADALIDAKVSFISRVHSSHIIFKDAVAQYRSSLECKENFLTYNGRFYYIKRIECRIGNKSDKVAYAYLGQAM